MRERRVVKLVTFLVVMGVAFGGRAQEGTLFVENDRVGIGTEFPSYQLEIVGASDLATRLQIRNISAATDFRTLLTLQNNGAPRIVLHDTSTGDQWGMLSTGTNHSFIFGKLGTGVNELTVFPGGNVTIAGEMTATDYNTSSSRTLKEDIVPVNSREVLERLVQLPLATWHFSKDESASTHLGPFAEDFHSLFGLGDSTEHIGVIDGLGVTMAAVQGLHRMVKTREIEMTELRKRNDDLERRLERLENLLQAQGVLAAPTSAGH